MSSRYIARKYGESRAQSVAADSWSRGSSQIRELGSAYSSRATTPVPGEGGERPWSSASTYNYYANQSTANSNFYANQTTATTASNSRPSTPPRELREQSLLPVRSIINLPLHGYSEALIKSSRKLRERSQSPTREHVANVRKVAQYQSNQDYYRGKVKSIYEREPLFADFVRNLPLTDLHASSSHDIGRIKRQFQHMVEDKWERKQLKDPSVSHDIAYKATSWTNYLGRREPASVLLAEKHSYRGRMETKLPRITVYHRSTQEPNLRGLF